MIAVRLNTEAADALGRFQRNRRRAQTLKGSPADAARESMRADAVDLVLAILAEHPSLNTGAEVLDEMLASGAIR